MSPKNDDEKPSQNSDHEEINIQVLVHSTTITDDGTTEQSFTVEVNSQEQEETTIAMVEGIFDHYGIPSSGIEFTPAQRENIQNMISIADNFNIQIDNVIQPIIKKPPEERMEMFCYITKELFKDGVNWGRIAVFLVVAAKLAWFQLSKTSVVRDFLLNFIKEYLFAWIIQSGGWESVKDYANHVIIASRQKKLNMVLGALCVCLLGYVFYIRK